MVKPSATVETLAPLTPPANSQWGWVPQGFLRGLLAYQLPYLNGSGHRAGFLPESQLWGSFFPWVAKETVGIQVADPVSFLRLAIPALPPKEATRPKKTPPLVSTVVPNVPTNAGFHNPDNARVPYPVPPPPDLYGKNPLVAIYYSDSQESFIPALGLGTSPNQAYSPDQGKSIVKVGGWLAQDLWQGHGVAVANSRAVNDPMGVIGSYENSALTATALLNSYPGVRLLLDLHRGPFTLSQSLFIWQGQKVAKIMLVVGTSARLPDPNWQTNFALAKNLARQMQVAYPGLLMGVYPSADRYNQELSPGAILLDVGGPYNTLDQEKRAVDLLSGVLAAGLKNGTIP